MNIFPGEAGTVAARPTKSRHWTMAIVGSVTALLASLLVFGVAEAGPGTVSVVDYAQCANQKPGGVDTSGSPDDCLPQGWINGILQASNSHYREDEVTPQRLEVFAQPGEHTITLRYMARKGSTHAYDSLATWNFTAKDADRCQGLTTGAKAGIGCDGRVVDADTLAITADDTVVTPFTSASGKTSDHDLDGQVLTMYGGDLTAMTAPAHDNASGSGDDYATTTISYTTTAPAHNVQLLFGGHLAAPTKIRGWGAGLAASSINGGPYHIKWDAADGASVGNRDNQIMGSAILPLSSPAIITVATTPVTLGGSITDTARLPGASADAGGTITFTLYADALCATTAIFTSTVSVTSVTVNGTAYRGATSGSYTPATAGSYYWVASYSGDSSNNPIVGNCGDLGETSVVNRSQPTISTTATPSSVTITNAATNLSDSVTVTAAAGGVTPTGGEVTFHLYFSATSSCSAKTEVAGSPVRTTLSAGAASSGNISVTPNAIGTYFWVASYAGDANNLLVSGACGDSGESVTVGQATPGGSTIPLLGDSVTVTGFNPTGTVTFTLHDSTDSTCADTSVGATGLVATWTETLSSGSASTSTTYAASTSGVYKWKVTYSGDTNNAAGTVSACGTESVNVTV